MECQQENRADRLLCLLTQTLPEDDPQLDAPGGNQLAVEPLVLRNSVPQPPAHAAAGGLQGSWAWEEPGSADVSGVNAVEAGTCGLLPDRQAVPMVDLAPTTVSDSCGLGKVSSLTVSTSLDMWNQEASSFFSIIAYEMQHHGTTLSLMLRNYSYLHLLRHEKSQPD